TRAQLVTWAERGALIAMSVATGGLNFWLFGGNLANGLLRWHRFGSTAWRGESRCVLCGAPLTEVSFKKSRYLYLVTDDAGPALRLACRSCRLRGRDGGHRLEGLVAQHVLRRVVTRHHFMGASENRVRSATDYIDRLGSPGAVTSEIAGRGLRLDALLDKHRRTEAVALEIALNDENERRLLELELAELEDRWREEEEIAAIVDGELTPVSGLERLRRELKRGGRGDRVSPGA
nr:hypothetical protein [Gemmatimonadota bacterium]NIU73073.1 hypothetical protein [Gammaproteobacteria bacterium]